MSDTLWQATLDRVRGEFGEMPCLRVTSEQARALFGLTTPAAQWVLDRLTNEGFLSRTANGDYLRKNAEP